MKRIVIALLCLNYLFGNFALANSTNHKEKIQKESILIKNQSRGSVNANKKDKQIAKKPDISELILEDNDYLTYKAKAKKNQFVRLSAQDYNELRKLARANLSIHQRIRNLEHAYNQFQKIIEGLNKVVNLIKGILGIAEEEEIDNRENEDLTGEWRHISGAIFNPGSVEFKISTQDGNSFLDMGLDAFEIDVYYNKQLFEIDHIEGSKVSGEEYSELSLRDRKSRFSKSRIVLPIADVLSNEAKFNIFLGPKDFNKAKLGDKSSIGIRYYKRVPKNPDGSPGTPPLIYERVSSHESVEIVTL